MKFTKNLSYHTPGELFREHSAETPREYAKEAYARTVCGVNTSFLLADGGTIAAPDLTPEQNTLDFANLYFVGVHHGTVTESGPGEWSADPLLFPFSDEELADAWQYLEDQVDGDDSGDPVEEDELESILLSLEASGESAAVSVADHIRTLASNGPEYATQNALLEEARNLSDWAERFADIIKARGN